MKSLARVRVIIFILNALHQYTKHHSNCKNISKQMQSPENAEQTNKTSLNVLSQQIVRDL